MHFWTGIPRNIQSKYYVPGNSNISQHIVGYSLTCLVPQLWLHWFMINITEIISIMCGHDTHMRNSSSRLQLVGGEVWIANRLWKTFICNFLEFRHARPPTTWPSVAKRVILFGQMHHYNRKSGQAFCCLFIKIIKIKQFQQGETGFSILSNLKFQSHHHL